MGSKIKSFSDFKGSSLIKDAEETSDVLDMEKLNSDSKDNYKIVNVIDVFTDKDTDKEIEAKLEKAGINLNSDIVGKDIKRGDYIYMTAILQKEKGTSFSSQTTTAVIKLRVVEIYKGLKHLNLASK